LTDQNKPAEHVPKARCLAYIGQEENIY